MMALFYSEWLKLKKTAIWLLAPISPLIAVLAGAAEGNRSDIDSPWLLLLGVMAGMHAWLFLPMLNGIFAALICRYEHVGGGWKQLLALPVSRTKLYIVKYVSVMMLIGLTQAIFLAVYLAAGAFLGLSSPVPWEELFRSVLGGWVACLPLAALQLIVSTAWPSFAAPLAVNVIFTIPNILIVNSAEYGPYYPWAQPLLAMMPFQEYDFGAFNVSAVTLFAVILGSFCLFLASGIVYFSKKAV